MRTLNIGKFRNLRTCSTSNGIFTILAVDHRDALRALINPAEPEMVTAEKMVDFKLSVVETLAPAATAFLLDPLYSAPQSIITGCLPPQMGFLVALEEQGYLGDPFQRRTTLVPGWCVEKAKRMGANGIKMLIFFHPGAKGSANEQINLVRSIAFDCQRYEVPLFLEPISFSLAQEVKKGSAEFAQIRPQIVIETAQCLSETGIDILKMEFPVDAEFEPDTKIWEKACRELDRSSKVPWVLLSAGEPFETFKEQIRIACQAGCSGFMVGRAIWQEAVKLGNEERQEFLLSTGLPRLKELAQIARKYGRSWEARYERPIVGESWFLTY